MKRLVFYSTLLILLNALTIRSYTQITLGAFAGLNNSKFVGDAPINAKYKSYAGINTGIMVDVQLSEYFTIGIQPSYSQEGSKVSYKVTNSKEAVDSIHIRLNYFSIPLLFKALTNNKHFYAIGGLEYAILLDSYEKIDDTKNDIPVDITTWNLVFHFGAGAKISLGRPKLLMEIRYVQGIVNLTDTSVYNSSIPRVKTSGFKFIVGIEIPLKKQTN